MSEKKIKFANVKKIVLSSLKRAEALNNMGVVCVSAFGVPYYAADKELAHQYNTLKGIQTNYPMFLHGVRVKDYLACNILYREGLDKVGKDFYIKEFDRLCEEADTDTIAFLGYDTKDSFCYKWILADYFRDCGAYIEYYDGEVFEGVIEEDFKTHQRKWNTDVYKKRGHFDLSDGYVGSTLEKLRWVNAKTAIKNPHSYTLRKDMQITEEEYLGLVKHIRCFGSVEVFWGFVYRVWEYNGCRYWTMPQDIQDEDCDLINRGQIKQKE